MKRRDFITKVGARIVEECYVVMRTVLMGLVAGIVMIGCAATPQGSTPSVTTAQTEVASGKNVTVNLTPTKNGTSVPVRASVTINKFMENCTTQLAGQIALQPGQNELMLPVAQAVLLIVEVELGRNGAEGRNLRGAVLNPKPDARYQFNINAVDGKFDYQLIEVSRSGKQELELVTTYSGCRSSRSSSNRAG